MRGGQGLTSPQHHCAVPRCRAVAAVQRAALRGGNSSSYPHPSGPRLFCSQLHADAVCAGPRRLWARRGPGWLAVRGEHHRSGPGGAAELVPATRPAALAGCHAARPAALAGPITPRCPAALPPRRSARWRGMAARATRALGRTASRPPSSPWRPWAWWPPLPRRYCTAGSAKFMQQSTRRFTRTMRRCFGATGTAPPPPPSPAEAAGRRPGCQQPAACFVATHAPVQTLYVCCAPIFLPIGFIQSFVSGSHCSTHSHSCSPCMHQLVPGLGCSQRCQKSGTREVKSTLPPHRITPTCRKPGCRCRSWLLSAAATPAAPEGSTTT